MKRELPREEIIRTTQDRIARNGIRAVRVDEIAQMLGISKRTLYEMFVDKNGLISACLDSMAHQQRKTLASNRRRCGGNPLQRALRLANTYMDNLYTVDASFLADIRDKGPFRRILQREPGFLGFPELTRDLEKCRKRGAAARGDRHRIPHPTAHEHDARTAVEPRHTRGAPPAVPDHSSRSRHPPGDRYHRPTALKTGPTTKKAAGDFLRPFCFFGIFSAVGQKKQGPLPCRLTKTLYLSCTNTKNNPKNGCLSDMRHPTK